MHTTRPATHRRLLTLALCVAALALGACEGSDSDATTTDTTGDASTTDRPWRGQHTHTLRLGASDNAEVVKAIPGQPRVILVSSKARQVTLLDASGDTLTVVRERSLLRDDATDSELTHIDVSADGAWAVLTRTLIERDAAGAQTRCAGELVFIDTSDSDTFGDILAQVEVGPMPDSVDISNDGSLVVSANERDGLDAWGKCEVPDAAASISLIDLSGGVATASELARVEMVDADTGPREPESIIISADNDLIVATLQDSHEVLILRRSTIDGMSAPTSADAQITRLPDDALGAGPWPDGVAAFTSGAGVEHFLIAGEWNDTLTIIDADGQVASSIPINPADIPDALPRVVDEGSPLFSPDSVAIFSRADRVMAAVTLRHAGAVAVYDVTDPAAPAFVQVIGVGDQETGGADEDGSVVRPEGIAAAADGAFIVTANEAESSASLILPTP